MIKFLTILITILVTFIGVSEGFAYKVDPGDWLQISRDGRIFRIYNPPDATNSIFVPGSNGSSIVQLSNGDADWERITWNGLRPATIRIYYVQPLSTNSTTSCARNKYGSASSQNSGIEMWLAPVPFYFGTSTDATTVLYPGTVAYRSPINESGGYWSSDRGSNELRCDFLAKYFY